MNLVAGTVEVYQGPSGPSDDPGYVDQVEFGAGESIAVVIGGKACGLVAVRDLLT